MLDLRDEMRKQGIECDASVVVDGQIHRFREGDDKRGRENGWYVFHADGDKTYGAFGSWRTGIRGTLGGKAARKVMAQVLRDDRANNEAKHERAATRAQMEWSAATGCWTTRNANPYLARKHVPPIGVRRDGDVLLVPMERDNVIVGLQKIYPDGQKRFTPGCKKLGASHLIGDVVWMLDRPLPTIVVAEGYATAASIHIATSLPVLVAFDCGNLLPAAKALTASRWIWAADNDEKTHGNPGVTKANAAAKELGGKVAVPTIAGDFNDLHLEQGLEAVAGIIYGAL